MMRPANHPGGTRHDYGGGFGRGRTIVEEVRQIIAFVEEQTGLPSRWNGGLLVLTDGTGEAQTAQIQAQREPILAALDRAMNEATVEAVREAQSLASAWLGQHPEDLVIWDAGEPIAMLADALAWMEAQKDREEMEEWKRHKAEVKAKAEMQSGLQADSASR